MTRLRGPPIPRTMAVRAPRQDQTITNSVETILGMVTKNNNNTGMLGTITRVGSHNKQEDYNQSTDYNITDYYYCTDYQ